MEQSTCKIEKKNKKNIGFIVVLLLLAILHFVLWAEQNEGYFVDELYTYGLSNSYMKPWPKPQEDYLNQYYSGDFFTEYLTVSENDKFAFDSVWNNQMEDVHPPFYYAVFHLVSSVFQETIHPWLGLGINLLFYIASILVFWRIAGFLFSETVRKITATTFFTFSIGVLYCALFIRMYMMLLFFSLLYLFILFRLTEDNLSKKKMVLYHVLAGIVFICGFLTHYYFIIPFAFLSACHVVDCIRRKKIFQSVIYCLVCLVSIVMTQYIFEYSFNHIFIGYRGVESIRNAKNAALFERAADMFILINKELFGGLLPWVVLLWGILFLCVIIKRRKNIENLKQNNKIEQSGMKISICITAILTFLAISKTAVLMEDRYLFVVYPYIILSFHIIEEFILNKYKEKVQICLTVITMSICLIFSYIVCDTQKYMYPESAVIPQLIECEYKDTDALYITDADYRYVRDGYALTFHDKIYVVNYNDLQTVSLDMDYQPKILYINYQVCDNNLHDDANMVDYYLEQMKDLGYSSAVYLGQSEYSYVYYLQRENVS